MPTRACTRTLAIGLLMFAIMPLGASCHDETGAASCPEGAAGCECAAGASCDPGLACEAGVCGPVVDDAGVPDANVGVDGAVTEDLAGEVGGADSAAPEDAAREDAGSCGGLPAPDFCACRENADCASGHCLPSSAGGSVCSRTCQTDCPEGFQCRLVTLPTLDPTYLCIEPALNLCRPCTEDRECQQDALDGSGARCVRYGEAEGSFCGIPCGADADCPGGYACREAIGDASGATVRQCVLADTDATCSCSGRAIAGSAFTTCAVGDCDGTRVCEPDGLSACRDPDGEVCGAPAEVVVSFDPQGGVLVGTASRVVAVGQPYGALPAATRDGHALAGWWTTPGGAGVEVRADTVVTATEAHTLHARWTADSVTVDFDSEGGTPCPPSTVTFGTAYGSGGPLCVPTREGHAFGGWWTGDDGLGSAVTAATIVATATDHVLHARWTADSLTVRFDSEGGTPCPPRTVTFGAAYGSGGPLCVPTRDGHAFGGWWTGDDGTGSAVTAATIVATATEHVLHARWTASGVNVTLDAHGGTGCPPSVAVTFGATYGAAAPLCRPARDGHTFEGWWTAEAGGSPVTSATRVTNPGDHTLHARWSPRAFTVTYDNNGGAGCGTLIVTFGAAYGANAGGLLCVPARAGHTFGGWYLGSAPVTAATLVQTASDHSLVARWNARAFTVAFDSEGGSPCLDRVVTFGAPYGAGGPLCVPTRAGFAFGGWWTGDDGTGSEVSETTLVATASAHVLHARWRASTFAVSFDPQGGTAPNPASLTVAFGAAYGALPSTARAGHTFAGWWTTPAAGGFEVTAATIVTVAGAHTLHARWSAKALVVRYESAGGTPCVDLAVTFGQPYGASVAGALCTPTRIGWSFDGWWSAPDATGTQVTATTTVATQNDHALFARWTANRYALTFDSEGGSACLARSVTFGSTYGDLCGPTRAGHTFGGWYLGDDGTGEGVTAATVVSTASNHVLHAHWDAVTVAVSFEPAGGSDPTPATLAVRFGASYGALPVTTRAGYAFGGWWTGAGGTGTQVSPGTSVTRADAHTLYAGWLANGYTVTYDNAGGSGCATHAVVFGERYDRSGPLCVPVRAGYAFAGWVDAAGASIEGATVVATAGPHPLSARWTARSLTVTFDSAGGLACPSRTVTFDAPYGALCATTRPGYAFAGWWTSDGAAGSEVTAATPVTTPNDHVLRARWTAATVAVTFDAGEGGPASPPGKTVTFGGLYGELATAERAGYTLAGWRTALDGTGELVTPLTEVTRPTSHTLYAAWTGNRYAVSFDSEGGSACADLTVTYGAAYGALCAPTRTGYDFGDWRTGDGGTGTVVDGSTIVSTASTHMLHARWTAKRLTVTFEAQGGATPVPASLAVSFGAPYGALPTTTRAGHTFRGWWTTPAAGGAEITATTLVATEASHVLHARWTANSYTVSFDSEGGSACASLTVTFGATYGAMTGGVLCAPERVGYLFEGWFDGDGDLGNAVSGATIVSTASDHMLHARWSAAAYQVSFDTRSPYLAPSPITVTFGAPYGALPATSRPGYVFEGWWSNAGCQAALIGPQTVVTTPGNHSLYARWRASEPGEAVVRIEPGAFTIGSPPDELGRGPDEWQSSVTLTRPFLMMSTEVTQLQWKRRSGGVNPSAFRDSAARDCSLVNAADLAPVESVTWWSAILYANALSREQGLPACYGEVNNKPDGSLCSGTWQAGDLDCGARLPVLPDGDPYACRGWRLPTEAEWEYAARSSRTGATWLGNLSGDVGGCAGLQPNLDPIAVWCGGGVSGPQMVALRGANWWGLFDMLGNVQEWTWDGWDSGLAPGGVDPHRTRVDAPARTVRGGAWSFPARYVRAAWRLGMQVGDRNETTGLRLVRTAFP